MKNPVAQVRIGFYFKFLALAEHTGQEPLAGGVY